MAIFKYFIAPFNAEHVKTQFRDNCKKLHPDAGGNAAKFTEMKDEYEKVLQFMAHGRREKIRRVKQGNIRRPAIILNNDEKEFLKDLREFALFAAKNVVNDIAKKFGK